MAWAERLASPSRGHCGEQGGSTGFGGSATWCLPLTLPIPQAPGLETLQLLKEQLEQLQEANQALQREKLALHQQVQSTGGAGVTVKVRELLGIVRGMCEREDMHKFGGV